MKEFIRSIRKSLDECNYHAAMFVALSIPDICGKLEYNIKNNGFRAKKWFSENLGSKYFPENVYESMAANNPTSVEGMAEEYVHWLKNRPIEDYLKLDSQDYWDLRNAFMHEASDRSGKKKVYLTHSSAHMNFVEDGLQISIPIFANDMSEAADKWLHRMRENEDVMERIGLTAKIQNTIMDGIYKFG